MFEVYCTNLELLAHSIDPVLRYCLHLPTDCFMASDEISNLNKLVTRLVHEVDVKNKQLKELERKCDEISLSHAQAMEEKDKQDRAYMEGLF